MPAIRKTDSRKSLQRGVFSPGNTLPGLHTLVTYPSFNIEAKHGDLSTGLYITPYIRGIEA